MLTRRKKWLRIAGGLLFLLLALAVSHEIPRWLPGGEDRPGIWVKLRGASRAATWEESWGIMTGERIRIFRPATLDPYGGERWVHPDSLDRLELLIYGRSPNR